MSIAAEMIDKEKVLKVGRIDQIKREISVMRLIRHPHVVELHELFNKVTKGKLKAVAQRHFRQLNCCCRLSQPRHLSPCLETRESVLR
ncbi:hypothetical protein EUGRSUZ_A00709 [Eucalyptus grandis]|uniref:Uncharacterized protein n=2 Tax=Eucalyptus grandis TaxID=71139 RepID=A0ACC3M0X5_EUCGR|nr:hypothetical protein EUGRSUZ_A00709 [Eucalyptus grandis]